MAIVGAASAFIESTLAQIWKDCSGKRRRVQGRSCVTTSNRLWGSAGWASLFAVLLHPVLCIGFNGLQAFNAASSLETTPRLRHERRGVACGIVLAVMTAFVIFGGAKRISVITSIIVPIMAFAYIAIAV